MHSPVTTGPSSEERLWAALSHFSAFLLGWGLIAPLIVWVTQRKKSAYVSFHALQALGYQMLLPYFWIIMSIVLPLAIIPLSFIVVFLAQDTASGMETFLTFLMPLMIFGGIVGGFALFIGIGILGAVICLSGKDFNYPILGKWLRRYLILQAATAEEGE
jgi:uncharacterized Tic20 family protein